jgi:hypothetical protein
MIVTTVCTTLWTLATGPPEKKQGPRGARAKWDEEAISKPGRMTQHSGARRCAPSRGLSTAASQDSAAARPAQDSVKTATRGLQ